MIHRPPNTARNQQCVVICAVHTLIMCTLRNTIPQLKIYDFVACRMQYTLYTVYCTVYGLVGATRPLC